MMLPPDPIYVFKGDMDAVMCLSYRTSDEVEQIYAGTESGKVYVWSLKSLRIIGNFKSGEDSCISVNIPKNEKDTVITQNKSGQICFWKEESNQWDLIREINTNFFGFCKAFIFQDTLYTSLKDSYCESISIKTQTKVNTFKLSDGNHLGEIMSLKVFEFQNSLYSFVAYESNQLILWSLNNFEKISKISSLQLTDCPMAFDFDTNSFRGICGNPSNKIDIFSLNKSNMDLKIIKTIILKNDGVASIQIRPDNKIVAIGCWDGKLRLYSWKKLTLLAALDIHSSTVQDVCFISCNKTKTNNSSSNKYLLIAGSKDSKMSLWDIYN